MSTITLTSATVTLEVVLTSAGLGSLLDEAGSPILDEAGNPIGADHATGSVALAVTAPAVTLTMLEAT